MNFQDVLNARRSIRRFKQDPIEDSVLLTLIDAAAKAPSASNNQPLRYQVIRKKSMVEKIFALTAWAGHVRPARDPKPGVTAPTAFIAVCAQNQGNDTPHPSALVDAGAAIQNILLQAVDLGLGACWLGAFDKAQTNRLLGLEEQTCMYLIALGYPSETPAMYRIHEGESTKYSLSDDDILQVPKYAPGDIAVFR